MEAGKRILHQFLDGSDKRFVIPVYQRNYDWRLENCQRLLDDLVRVHRARSSSHFFGGIVYFKPHVAGADEYQIIDGQQRLTTVTLFLLALSRLVKNGTLSVLDKSLTSRINDYLVDKYAPETSKVKLKPINEDDEAYRRLFDEDEKPLSGSKVTENYQFFLDAIVKTGLSADDLYGAFKKLEFVDISIEQKDNPQLIFESINSTGVSLTEGDKIRNYVLMDLESSIQEQFFKKYWKPVEELVDRGRDEDSVGLFIRDYLSMERSSISNLNRIYVDFKQFTGEEGVGSPIVAREALLSRLHAAAKSYQLILKPSASENLELAAALADLQRLDCQPANPFLLRVLQMQRKGEMTITQVVCVMRMVESFLIRRLICDLPTHSLTRIFAELHRSTAVVPESYPYEDRVAYALCSRVGATRFPTDGEFRAGLRIRRIYEMRTRPRAYFLSRLENGTSKSSPVHGAENVVYNKILSGILSVEHVMPQTPTKAWQEEIGPEFARVHEEWLHRLGNLTLTAYNSEMSNKSFSAKTGRSLADLKADNFGFVSEGNHVFLNAFIAMQDHWNETVMERRTKLLTEVAFSIWKYPAVVYSPPVPPTFSYSLRQHKSNFFTGARPIAVDFKGDRYPVESWVSLAHQVITLLVKESPETLRESAKNSNSKLFSDEPNQWTELVISGVNAVFTGSTWDRCRMLKIAISAFDNLDLDLVFDEEIVDEEEPEQVPVD